MSISLDILLFIALHLHVKPVLTECTDMIDKSTLEIKQDEDKTVYKDLQDIGDDLPDHSPRFVLLSYPVTLVS